MGIVLESKMKNGMSSRAQFLGRLLVYIIAFTYGYGGLVHIANMAGLSGYSWVDAPLKWQILDVVYLSLDAVVFVGLLRSWRVATAAFFVASSSQIFLYTVGAHWIMTVPAEFLPIPGHEMSLNFLVGYHLVALAMMVISLKLRGLAT